MQPKLSKKTLELIGQYQKRWDDYTRAKADGFHVHNSHPNRAEPDAKVQKNIGIERFRLADMEQLIVYALRDDRERP